MDITAPIDLAASSAMAWTWATEFLPRLGAAIAIAIVGMLIAGWLGRLVARLVTGSEHVDTTLAPVAGAAIRYAILVIVLVAALGQLGIRTTSLLTVIGGAALAIGLALQGTLSNIAAGLMLLWLRPFRAGDYIEVDTVAGTVEEVQLFHTQIRTWDGIFKFVPNAQLWNVTLTNYTRNPTRLVRIEFGVAYEDDIARARDILKETAAAHASVDADPPPDAVPLQLADSAVVIELRAWTTIDDFWTTRWDLTQAGKKALEAAGISIPFPQRVVHMIAPESDRPPAKPAKAA